MTNDPNQPDVTLDTPDGADPTVAADHAIDELSTPPEGADAVADELESVATEPSDDAVATEPTLSSDQVQAVEAMQFELESLRRQLAQQAQQLESHKTQALRIAADFDNFRKRTQKEKEDLEYMAKRTTLAELLPVVDNFERARSHIKAVTEGEATIHKSYQSVYKNLVDILKRLGVAPMRPEGQEFDPNFHEAMMRQPTNEYAEGAVMEQLVRGYLLHDRVLRHAMVKVAAPPEPERVEEEAIANDSDAETE